MPARETRHVHSASIDPACQATVGDLRRGYRGDWRARMTEVFSALSECRNTVAEIPFQESEIKEVPPYANDRRSEVIAHLLLQIHGSSNFNKLDITEHNVDLRKYVVESILRQFEIYNAIPINAFQN